MKIVILGAGQVGRSVAYQLSREESNEVTVVDTNEEVLRDLPDRIDIRTIAGNASWPTVLEAAGANEADVLIALTNSDEVNMLACEVAYTLFRTPTKIARIRASEYTNRRELFAEGALSVDYFISPEQLLTEYIERLLNFPGTLQVLDFADGKLRLVGVRARHNGKLVGRCLREIREHIPDDQARVVAIYRRGTGIKPDGDTVIEDGDEVFFLAAGDYIRSVMTELRKDDAPARRVVIAGAGHIGLRLARTIEKNHQVKLIERDASRARKASEVLEKTIVLHGDAADEELLLEENIDSVDVFAALTNSEEANILSAMLAKRLGARKVMALINKPSYAELIESGTIDLAISPETVTIGSLLEHVRRGHVVKVHALRRGAAEAMEIIVHGSEQTSRVVGRRLEEIKLPEGVQIGALVRRDEVIMCHHDTIMQENDHLIVFLTDRRHVGAVERLFLGTQAR
jgi:trk system potassium uptake protein TrkA